MERVIPCLLYASIYQSIVFAKCSSIRTYPGRYPKIALQILFYITLICNPFFGFSFAHIWANWPLDKSLSMQQINSIQFLAFDIVCPVDSRLILHWLICSKLWKIASFCVDFYHMTCR